MKPIPLVIRSVLGILFFGSLLMAAHSAISEQWDRGLFFLVACVVLCVLGVLTVELFD